MILAAVAGIAVVAGVAPMLGTGGSAGAASSTLTPVADADVRADQPASNFGAATGLRVDGNPITNAYLRFEVSVPLGEAVTRATLRVYTPASSGSGITVHGVASNTWSESSITYGNAPPTGAAAGASGAYGGNAYVSVDVTQLVTGTGAVSMAIKRSSTTSNTFNSREASTNRPQLIIETAPPFDATTVVYALGDGADGSATSKALADYIRSKNPDRFFYLGDVYHSGTATEFANNYDPLYGGMAAITDPVIGNHEYGNRSTGYYPYWQSKRGWTQEEARHRAYVDASGWQIIAYSSDSDMTAEGQWVAAQVAVHAGTCRIVMAHRGRHVVVDTVNNDNTSQEPVWSQIAGKTAINLVGHNHIYGRLASLEGVNVIVSGAGGYTLRSLGSQHHPVAAFKTGIPTATRLALRRGAADFQQVDQNGTVYDSGTIACTPAS